MNEPDIFDTSTADDLTDAAIEAALRDLDYTNRPLEEVRESPHYFPRTIIAARVIQRHYPERMEDPDLAVVREIVARQYAARGNNPCAEVIRAGAWDGVYIMSAALAAYKAGKEAGK